MNDTLSAALTFSMLSTVYIKEYFSENKNRLYVPVDFSVPTLSQ